MTPLHWAVYKVLDLPCIYVVSLHLIFEHKHRYKQISLYTYRNHKSCSLGQGFEFRRVLNLYARALHHEFTYIFVIAHFHEEKLPVRPLCMRHILKWATQLLDGDFCVGLCIIRSPVWKNKNKNVFGLIIGEQIKPTRSEILQVMIELTMDVGLWVFDID